MRDHARFPENYAVVVLYSILISSFVQADVYLEYEVSAGKKKSAWKYQFGDSGFRVQVDLSPISEANIPSQILSYDMKTRKSYTLYPSQKKYAVGSLLDLTQNGGAPTSRFKKTRTRGKVKGLSCQWAEIWSGEKKEGEVCLARAGDLGFSGGDLKNLIQFKPLQMGAQLVIEEMESEMGFPPLAVKVVNSGVSIELLKYKIVKSAQYGPPKGYKLANSPN